MLFPASRDDLNEIPSEEKNSAWNDLNIQYQFLASIIDNEIVDPILVIGTDYRVKFANNAACNFAGKNECSQTTEPLCHKLIFGSDTPCIKAGKPCPLVTITKNNKTVSIEQELILPSGEIVPYEIHAAPFNNSDGEFIGIIESFQPITLRNEFSKMFKEGHKELELRVSQRTEELLRNNKILGEQIVRRQQVEEILRAEKDKFRRMLMATKQGMHILNTDYKIEFQNDVLLDLVGDQVGRYCYEVYKNRTEPCEECLMQKAAETDTVQSDIEVCISQGRFFRKNYTTFKDTDGKKKCLILFNDITEIRAYQAKKVRTSQLASIGELAAGVAHEINNPINGMINYAQLLIDNINEAGDIKAISTRIIKEGERVADIVSNLLSFARQGDDDDQTLTKTNVQDSIENCLTLVRHQLIKDGINITIEIQPDVPAVWVHPQQLEQVFINLLSNARYALNEKFKGKDRNKKLAIKISTVEMVGTTYVRTSIKDFGIGIPSDIIDHVYDPFFSTKKLGEGTGLGLSISRSLVKKFKGFLRIKSDPGNYTNIMVDIPTYNGSQNNDQ